MIGEKKREKAIADNSHHTNANSKQPHAANRNFGRKIAFFG
jgi:hypothetical protein